MMEKQSSAMAAGAMAAKTARACDSCLRRRARWFCAADDAFLCQSCDNSVHSANTLARRHQRVRLNTASSSKPPPMLELDTTTTPAWLHGLKKKARTPRGKHTVALDGAVSSKVETLVPDLEENQHSCDDEHLLYHVPMIGAEFSPQKLHDHMLVSSVEPKRSSVQMEECNQEGTILADTDALAEFHPTDVELSDFVADMETLLGGGIEEESFGIDSLGLMDEEDSSKTELSKGESEFDASEMGTNISRENIDLDFNYAPQRALKDFEGHRPFLQTPLVLSNGNEAVNTTDSWKKILKLDYEATINEWSSVGSSPWIDGQPPSLTPNFLSEFTVIWGNREVHERLGILGHEAASDGGREARVTRYREKRRTRLFSKKIRYEVRKLNAEKRPRMKGRFVKSSTFPVGGTTTTPAVFRK